MLNRARASQSAALVAGSAGIGEGLDCSLLRKRSRDRREISRYARRRKCRQRVEQCGTSGFKASGRTKRPWR